MPPPKLDEFGRQVEQQPLDMWPSRSGIALALKHIAPLLKETQIPDLFEFFVPKALSDRAPEVRSGMRDAALCAIQSHGKVHCCYLSFPLSVHLLIVCHLSVISCFMSSVGI